MILYRLGARTWGGIGLATALVFALAMLPTYSSVTRANPNSGSAPVSVLAGPDSPEPRGQPGEDPSRRTNPQEEPQEGTPNRLATQTPDHSAPFTDGSNQKGGAHANDATGTSAGRGTGQSRTDSHDAGPSLHEPGRGDANSRSGQTSGGVGREAPAQSGKNPAGGSASGSATANSVPPWRSDHWQSDVQRANEAMQSGEIPDSYRDVIRGYFDRSSDGQ